MTAAAKVGVTVIAFATFGCLHMQVGRDRPGHVALAAPPAALVARGTLPAEPVPAPAIVVSAGAMLDWGARCLDGACRREGALGFELGLYFTRVTLAQITTNQRDPDYSWSLWSLGVNVGWTPPETRTFTPAVPQPAMYAEVQGRYGVYGLAAGAAITPGDGRAARNGFQLAELWGPVYLREQVLLDGSFAISLGLALKVPVTISF